MSRCAAKSDLAIALAEMQIANRMPATFDVDVTGRSLLAFDASGTLLWGSQMAMAAFDIA